ncbi:lysoplasmalogenase family protein [Microbacterium sp.]|uniref:lysoplasmalogenase family protein n=1 Tax=Microbacterium sp. TaxID=51671 RepID=UPI0037361FEF
MNTAAPASLRTRTRWWGFGVYALISAIHVASIALGWDVIEYPTKLALMPTLALAAVWALPSRRPGSAATVVFFALAFSWLGDGAAFFFPFLSDELPAMLLCFGLAHVAYIWLFWRRVATRPVPAWCLVYVAWWIAMVALLWPSLGALAVAVAVYGVVLGGTAALSARGGAMTAIGGAVFLISDTLLALRIFLPEVVAAAASGPWIMLTYTLGQGLLVAGIIRLSTERS